MELLRLSDDGVAGMVPWSLTPMKTPLTVIVVRQGASGSTELYTQALRRAFLGLDAAEALEAPDYEWMHPLDFRVFTQARSEAPLDSSLLEPDAERKSPIWRDSSAVLVIVLLSEATSQAEDLLRRWVNFSQQQEITDMSVLGISVSSAQAPQIRQNPMPSPVMLLGLDDLGERDLRQDMLCLYALDQAVWLLNRRQLAKSPGSGGQPRIFFSHAKRDGVPLAYSLRGWMNGLLKRFRYFYDTDHLDLKGDLSAQLQDAVAGSGSIIVVLRTEAFDSRYWCQKEVYWAEHHGVPVLTVDARWNIRHSPAVIGFDGTPSVRVPDGSLTRILLAAYREALRVYLLRERVRETALASQDSASRRTVVSFDDCSVLSRYPTLISLEAATKPNPAPCYLVYPNPTMPDELEVSARRVAESLVKGINLVSLDQFRVLCLG